MEYQGDNEIIIRETAEATLREMEFYRELRKRRMALSLWKAKAELTPEQEIAFQRSTCDPLVKQAAKMILEECQHDKNLRKMAYRALFYIMLFFIIILVTIPTIIYFAVRGSGHSKYKSKY